jgi:plasmid stabilization system protein ParE
VIRLLVTRNAENDMARILAYLEDEANAIVAEEFGRDVRRTLLPLMKFPDSGAPRPELGPDARVVVVYPYLLIYDHAAPNLTLLRILHGKANLTAEILMRP